MLGLSEKAANLRNLNLSYNTLNNEGTNCKDTEDFISNFNDFIQKARAFTHLSFCGMNWKRA